MFFGLYILVSGWAGDESRTLNAMVYEKICNMLVKSRSQNLILILKIHIIQISFRGMRKFREKYRFFNLTMELPLVDETHAAL